MAALGHTGDDIACALYLLRQPQVIADKPDYRAGRLEVGLDQAGCFLSGPRRGIHASGGSQVGHAVDPRRARLLGVGQSHVEVILPVLARPPLIRRQFPCPPEESIEEEGLAVHIQLLVLLAHLRCGCAAREGSENQEHHQRG